MRIVTDEVIKRMLERANTEGDIVVGDDGYYVYWPKRSGAISAYQLRALADELDRLNKPWEDTLNAYFEEHQND